MDRETLSTLQVNIFPVSDRPPNTAFYRTNSWGVRGWASKVRIHSCSVLVGLRCKIESQPCVPLLFTHGTVGDARDLALRVLDLIEGHVGHVQHRRQCLPDLRHGTAVREY